MENYRRPLTREELRKYLVEEPKLKRYKLGDSGEMLAISDDILTTGANARLILNPVLARLRTINGLNIETTVVIASPEEVIHLLFTNEGERYDPNSVRLSKIPYSPLDNSKRIYPFNLVNSFHRDESNSIPTLLERVYSPVSEVVRKAVTIFANPPQRKS
jgi:hypothetical protein